ncbi:MAG: hypothetical protein LQ352_001930 [Teloschistes flavicans]|nr:MAG: hypothetical protein LQ352_001930 [Teloschistes flavicans]
MRLDIYGFNKNVSKPEEFYSAFRVNKNAINTFNTSSKEAHRRKRRIMAQAFSETALRSYERFISMRVEEFVRKLNGWKSLEDGPSGPRTFNMAYEFNCLMLDIMGGLCFGEAFGFVTGQGDDVMKQAHARTFRIYMTGHEPLLKRTYLDRLFFPQLLRAHNALGSYASQCTFRRIAKYQAQGSGKDDSVGRGYEDIMSHLLDAGDDETGTKYTNNELLGEGILMMMAGSDTSSSSLTATIFYLVQHPAVLRRLQQDLWNTFSALSKIQPVAAETHRYLRACMDEAMRLSPPAPTNIPRVVGSGGINVAGEHLPENIYVGVPNFTIFRDPSCFSDPHSYIPERWIVDSKTGVTEESVKRAQQAFQPFSLGPRHCIGKHLAMKEVSFILANVLWLFDVEKIEGSGVLDGKYLPGVGEDEVVLEQSDVYTSLEEGPQVKLTLRPDLKM